MAIYWRQWCSSRAQDQHRLGVAALEAGDVVGALLHLRAAVRLDCHIQRRAETAEVYERGARLWRESAELRDEIRRREDLARKPVGARVRHGEAMASPTQACCSYKPGHGTHYIAPLRAYAKTPRDPITIVGADADGWITFLDQESNEHRWWHHDGARLVALYEPDVRFWRVRDSRFLVAQRGTENSFPWIYCDAEPSPCVMERSADPIDAIKNEGGFVMRPSAAVVDGMVNSIADALIEQINAERRRLGLPELEED